MPAAKCILVGHGYWGTILEKYLPEAGFEIEYIYTGKEEFSFEELLEKSRAEAVFICSPVSTHADYVRQSLLAGMHVFCEKMLCADPAVAAELFELADKKGRVLFTDYIYLYSPSVRTMKAQMKNLGTIHTCDAQIAQYGKFYQDVDVIGNIGVHMMSATGYLSDFQDTDDIMIISRELAKDIDLSIAPALDSNADKACRYLPEDQILNIHLAYIIQGMHTEIRASLLSDEKIRRIHLEGEHGSMTFDMMKDPALEIVTDEGNLSYHFDEQNNLTNALAAFSQCIKDPSGSAHSLNRQCSKHVENLASKIY